MLERGELAEISVKIHGKSSWEGNLQRRLGGELIVLISMSSDLTTILLTSEAAGKCFNSFSFLNNSI